MDISRSYRRGRARWWRSVTDGEVALVVALVVLGVWLQRLVPVVAAAALLASTRRVRLGVLLLGVVVGGVGVERSVHEWRGAVPRTVGAYAGRVCLVTDPAPAQGAVAVVVEIEGERFQVWARGSPGRRLSPRLAGECAAMQGRRRVLNDESAHRAAIRHVVGRFDIDRVGEWDPGGVADRASNRVRRLFAAGASLVHVPDDALFAGLVIGDDRYQSLTVVQQFRSAGLSHLTAVSGSNVAFVLAAAAPILRRLRPSVRWLATLGAIAWFAALTRFEPSIVRASVMASIAATGVLLGREKPPGRVLALAVGVLVLVDPMLVWSVGFWLSVAATAGVALLSGRVAALLPGPRWFAVPAGVTIGAQIAVAPVSLLVFGSLPIVSVPANLLAVPVAGFVMLYGLPAGLAAGALGGGIGRVVQFPSGLGTHWVATVAALAARVEPPAPWPVIGWATLLAFLGMRAMRCAKVGGWRST
jgi:competence protein ComEC